MKRRDAVVAVMNGRFQAKAGSESGAWKVEGNERQEINTE
jgi:hypothetical protein